MRQLRNGWGVRITLGYTTRCTCTLWFTSAVTGASLLDCATGVFHVLTQGQDVLSHTTANEFCRIAVRGRLHQRM